jgi:hypothetical protein
MPDGGRVVAARISVVGGGQAGKAHEFRRR